MHSHTQFYAGFRRDLFLLMMIIVLAACAEQHGSTGSHMQFSYNPANFHSSGTESVFDTQ